MHIIRVFILRKAWSGDNDDGGLLTLGWSFAGPGKCRGPGGGIDDVKIRARGKCDGDRPEPEERPKRREQRVISTKTILPGMTLKDTGLKNGEVETMELAGGGGGNITYVKQDCGAMKYLKKTLTGLPTDARKIIV